VRLLARMVGERRVRGDRPAAENIVLACDGMPLALRVIGTRLASVPDWPLHDVARRLVDPRHRLDELRLADLDVRARYAAAYRSLGAAEQSLLGALGRLGARRFTAADLAGALGRDGPAQQATLARLVEHHLVRVAPAGPGTLRYTLPELAFAYALECAPARRKPRRSGALRSGRLLTAAR
jgi:hypothetical protein